MDKEAIVAYLESLRTQKVDVDVIRQYLKEVSINRYTILHFGRYPTVCLKEVATDEDLRKIGLKFTFFNRVITVASGQYSEIDIMSVKEKKAIVAEAPVKKVLEKRVNRVKNI